MKLLSLIVVCTLNLISVNNHSLKMHPKLELQYLIREPIIKSAHPPVIILLHGVGSNEKDLFSFANEIPDEYLVISAQAPIDLGNESYAWYQVDFSSGQPIYNKQQAEQSRLSLVKFIGQIKSLYQVDEKYIYLCGFSQGGIMSYSVGLTNPNLVKGIAVMSGRLLDDIKPQIKKSDALKSLKVFISHGIKDQTLGVHYAREGKLYLEQLGIHPIYKEYQDEHTINAEMLKDMLKWLKSK